jgi:hypothetical protein
MCRLCDSPAAAVLAHRLASTRARVESKSEAAHPCPSLSGSLGQGSHGFFLQPPSSNREKPRRKRSERCRRRAHSPNLRQACQSRQLETLTGSCKGSAFRHTDAGVSVGWSRLYLTGLAVLLQDRPRPAHTVQCRPAPYCSVPPPATLRPQPSQWTHRGRPLCALLLVAAGLGDVRQLV